MSLLILIGNLVDSLQKFQIRLKNNNEEGDGDNNNNNKESLINFLEAILNLDNKIQNSLTDLQELDKLGRNLHLSEKRLNSIKGEYSNFLEQVQNQIYKTEENIRELEYGKNLIENLDFDVCGLMKFAYRIACQKVSFGRPPYPTEDLMRRTYLFDDQIKNIYKSQIPLISNDLIKDEKIKGELIETDSKETMMRESQIVKREKNVVINLDIESDGMNTEADE